MKIKFKNIKPFNLDNKIRTADFVAGYELRNKYYLKEITAHFNP
jgi:hypothetical protein